MTRRFPTAYDIVTLEGNTIEEYLKALLKMVWVEEEGFDGKRPFGNSGWHDDIYTPLVREGYVGGSFDADGALYDCDYYSANEFILKLIEDL